MEPRQIINDVEQKFCAFYASSIVRLAVFFRPMLILYLFEDT